MIFDETTSSIYERNDTNNQFNRHHLFALQEQANEKLNRVGYVFLNDVRESCGLEPTIEGQYTGWIKNGNGDGHIDFGIDLTYTDPRFKDFIDKEHFCRKIVLDFNVDGVIIDKVLKTNRNNGLSVCKMAELNGMIEDAQNGRALKDPVIARADEEAWAMQNK